MLKYLRKKRANIIMEDRATNTMENAMYSAKVVNSLGIHIERAIICCQAFHARRAYMSYACHFKGTELIMVPSETQNITSTSWYKTEDTYKKIMLEVKKCGEYFAVHADDLVPEE